MSRSVHVDCDSRGMNFVSSEVCERQRINAFGVGEDESIATVYCSVEGGSVGLGELSRGYVDVTGDEGRSRF
jgi:hypothetical protein